MKKLVAAALALVMLMLPASCGAGPSLTENVSEAVSGGAGGTDSASLNNETKADENAVTAPPDETTAKNEPSAATTAVPATDVAPEEIDLSGYPAELLGIRMSDIRSRYSGIGAAYSFGFGFADQLYDTFPGVHYLAESGRYGDDMEPRGDAEYVTLFTSSEKDVYPGLAAGGYYDEYQKKFSISSRAYSRDYGAYYALIDLKINGRDAKAYLFFYDADARCRSIVITLLGGFEYVSVPVAENDRDNYPVFFMGRQAEEMRRKYQDDFSTFSDFNYGHSITGIIGDSDPDGSAEQFGEDDYIGNVHIGTEKYDFLPGYSVGADCDDIGAELSEAEPDTGYLGTFFVAGIFVEVYVYVGSGSVTEYVCHGKQLF